MVAIGLFWVSLGLDWTILMHCLAKGSWHKNGKSGVGHQQQHVKVVVRESRFKDAIVALA